MSGTVVSLIAVILVAVFSSITAPLILAHRTERMHREDRMADYERQDQVAAQAAKAATDQADRAAKAAADLAESQREIAAVAAEAARLLLIKQEETVQAQKEVAAQAAQAAQAAELLLANNERVAETQRATNGKLDVIHVLVNSNMTAAMQSELNAIRRELAMMREVIAVNLAAGREPTPEALAALDVTQARITELAATLKDRNDSAAAAAAAGEGAEGSS